MHQLMPFFYSRIFLLELFLLASGPTVFPSLLFPTVSRHAVLNLIFNKANKPNQSKWIKPTKTKKADPICPSSYCPVSLLYYLIKVLELVIFPFSNFSLHISSQLISIRTLFSIEILFFRVINEHHIEKSSGLISVIIFEFLVAFDRIEHYFENMSWNAFFPCLVGHYTIFLPSPWLYNLL